MTEKSEYWLEFAQSNFKNAKSFLRSKKFPEFGGLAYQIVEKILMAYYWHETKDSPPFNRNLIMMCEQSELIFLLDESKKNMLRYLTVYHENIDKKGKEHVMALLMKEKAAEIFESMEEFYHLVEKLIGK